MVNGGPNKFYDDWMLHSSLFSCVRLIYIHLLFLLGFAIKYKDLWWYLLTHLTDSICVHLSPPLTSLPPPPHLTLCLPLPPPHLPLCPHPFSLSLCLPPPPPYLSVPPLLSFPISLSPPYLSVPPLLSLPPSPPPPHRPFSLSPCLPLPHPLTSLFPPLPPSLPLPPASLSHPFSFSLSLVRGQDELCDLVFVYCLFWFVVALHVILLVTARVTLTCPIGYLLIYLLVLYICVCICIYIAVVCWKFKNEDRKKKKRERERTQLIDWNQTTSKANPNWTEPIPTQTKANITYLSSFTFIITSPTRTTGCKKNNKNYLPVY